MSEWKELKIDDLPSDILTGGYEWEIDADFWSVSYEPIMEILRKAQLPSFYYRYRKPEPKPPTHKEIITKWWLIDSEWQKVVGYDFKRKEYFNGEDWNNKQWFTFRESEDIPPESLDG